jgi:UDP-N-acetylglucosamine 2-epimerase (non-hydrolysing)
VVDRCRPDCVVVEGDTTSVLATSLVALHRRVGLVHVEAGLRTGDLRAPWPEEFNRRAADLIAALYCAPTERAAQNLLAEGCPPERVHVTGNTIVDALVETLGRERNNPDHPRRYAMLGDAPVVLVTAHRRESFGEPLQNVCRAVAQLADRFADIQFVWPVHLNPNVRGPVHRALADRANVHLLGPVAYGEFVWLMDRSRLILTDSGGVQEEAPSLGKPVLVMRALTERPEAVLSGAARLVGTSVDSIVQGVAHLLTDEAAYAACQIDRNPYGDGHAAERIVTLMLEEGWRG